MTTVARGAHRLPAVLRLIDARAAFLAGSAVVHAGNYAFNLVMGRTLGPALFSDIAVIVTLLLTVTVAAGTMQTAAAKAATEPAGASLQPRLRRRAAAAGITAGAGMAASADVVASFFNSASPWPFVIFGLGMPAYFAQAVDRGFLQGAASFGRLAASYQAEMWVRLGGAVLLVAAGFGLNGAVAALSLSFVASWAVARPGRQEVFAGAERGVATIAGPAAMLAVGEVLINHSDLLIVKHFLEPATAGAYGAIAVLGRVPFFVAWSVAAVAFPYAARRGVGTHRTAVGTVALLSAAITVGAWAMPGPIVGTLFGNGYVRLAGYLGPYALAASLFAVVHTVVLLELARGRRLGAALVLTAGIAQTLALWSLHTTIAAVIAVQVGLMGALAVAVAAWWLRPSR